MTQKIFSYCFLSLQQADITNTVKKIFELKLHCTFFLAVESGSGVKITESKISASLVQEISNGICSFNPTSKRGKATFLIQTMVLSFLPIALLIVQNSFGFYGMVKWKTDIIEKDKLVHEATVLSRFIINLQLERAMVCLAVFLDARSGKATDLTKAYSRTDQALETVKWRTFSNEKIFKNKLRFQIRVDDFRYIYYMWNTCVSSN